MIFFLNLDGTCTRQDTDHIYQGSNNVSKVIAITSISPERSHLGVAFTLPNELPVGYLPMASKGTYNVEGNPLPMYLWTLDLPYNVTDVQGTVGVSFNVVNSITGANMTSYTNTFEVEYSVLPTFDKPPTPDEWEQILNLLEAYAAVNPGIVEKLENFQIGTVTAQASEPGAQPEVTAEIVNETTPNGYKLNMNFMLPRGEVGKNGLNIFYSTFQSSPTDKTMPRSSINVPDGRTLEKNDLVIANSLLFIVTSNDTQVSTCGVNYVATLQGDTGVGIQSVNIMSMGGGAYKFNIVYTDGNVQQTDEFYPPKGDNALMFDGFLTSEPNVGATMNLGWDRFNRIPVLNDIVNVYWQNENMAVGGIAILKCTVPYAGVSTATFEVYEVEEVDNVPPVSTTTPLMDGTASVGTENAYARGDHRHPSDESKANTSGTYPNLTVGKATVAEHFHKLSHLQQNFSGLLNNYFLIGTLPQMNNNFNGDEIDLSGSIGAFLATQKQTVEITVSSRDNYVMTGITKLGTDNVNYLNGIEFWTQSDGTVNVYFKVLADYMSVNLVAFASLNATVSTWDDFVTPITAPTGTRVDYSNNVITLISSAWGNNDKVRIQPGSIDMFSPIADISSTSLPSDSYPNFSTYDKNGEWYSTFRGVQHTGGTVSAQMAVHRVVNGEHAERGVQIRLEPNGYSSFWPGWGDTDLGAAWSNNQWKNIYHSGFINKFRYATWIHHEEPVSQGIHSYNTGIGSIANASQIIFLTTSGGAKQAMMLPYSEFAQGANWIIRIGTSGGIIFKYVSDTEINIVSVLTTGMSFDLIIQ